jgi:mevalonate kinase
MTRQTVRAPGKVFLFGEWAVIAGAPAVVMAVDRHVRVRFLPGATGSAPLVQAARRMAEEFLGSPLPPLPGRRLSALFLAGRKIGLGSSAAVAAAAVGSVFAEQGCDLSELPVRWTILRLAREVHRRLQGGRGSGVDVAAAVFGGIRVHRTGITGPEAPPAFALPPGLSVRFLWTGREVSTPDRLEVFEEFRSRQPVPPTRRWIASWSRPGRW